MISFNNIKFVFDKCLKTYVMELQKTICWSWKVNPSVLLNWHKYILKDLVSKILTKIITHF